MHLVLRAKWLNQPDDMPVGEYKTKKSKVIYLTGNKIAEFLRKAVKSVWPDTRQTQAGLGLHIAWWGRKVAWLHQEEALLDGWLIQDVPTGYSSHLASACQRIAHGIAGGHGPHCCLASRSTTMTDGNTGPDMHEYVDRMS